MHRAEDEDYINPSWQTNLEGNHSDEEKYDSHALELYFKKSVHVCDKCYKTYTDPSSLRKHKLSAHDGIRYPCDLCTYKATRKSNLKLHVTTVHRKVDEDTDYVHEPEPEEKYLEGSHSEIEIEHNIQMVKQENYDNRTAKLHFKSVHTCDKCDKTYTDPSSLRKHKLSAHDGIRYPCDQCNLKATQKHSLLNHIEKFHNI